MHHLCHNVSTFTCSSDATSIIHIPAHLWRHVVGAPHQVMQHSPLRVEGAQAKVDGLQHVLALILQAAETCPSVTLLQQTHGCDLPCASKGAAAAVGPKPCYQCYSHHQQVVLQQHKANPGQRGGPQEA